jgi:hypothetical protein
MKRISLAGIVASLLIGSGAASAAEPFVLADSQLDRVTAGADPTPTPRVGLPNIVEQGNLSATIDGVIEPLTVIEVSLQINIETPAIQHETTFTHRYSFGFERTN